MHETRRIEMSYEQAQKISNDFLKVLKTLYQCKPLQCSTEKDICYNIIFNNRFFEITLFDEPEDLGFGSILSDYDPSTYIACNIVEKRPDGKKKYEMTFGFDIEKKTFLELFEITHYNTVGTERVYGDNYYTRLETDLKDTLIF